MASLAESTGIKNVADTFADSVVHPVTNAFTDTTTFVTDTFSDLVNTGTSWFEKGWQSRRRRRRRRDSNPELELPVENFLNAIFEAANTTVSVLQEKSVWEASKIVFIGILMILNFAIAFTLPLYI